MSKVFYHQGLQEHIFFYQHIFFILTHTHHVFHNTECLKAEKKHVFHKNNVILKQQNPDFSPPFPSHLLFLGYYE